jgi:RHS repeat-associated protein
MKFILYFRIILATLAMVLFASHAAFSAVTRHQGSAGDADIGGLQLLSVSVPNSADCAGGSYGNTSFTNSWIVGGCRGCAFRIDFTNDATVSGQTINGDRAYTKFNKQTGVDFSFTNYIDFQDTNNPCNAPVSIYNHSTRDLHGLDKVDLIYETDGRWNQGLSVYVTGGSARVLAVFDDHGDVVFDVENLTADKKSKAHARVTNPLAYPTNVLAWRIRGGTNEEETLGCTINTTTGEITAGEISGKIAVQAYATDTTDCFIEAELKVGCDSCVAEGCTGSGSGNLEVNSVDIKIGAGKAEFGDSAGLFRLKEDYPSAALSNPQDLKYYIGSVDTNQVVVLRTNGYIRQVFAPQTLANVVSNSAVEYKIEFYSPGSYGTQPTNAGLYGITGFPVTTWTIKNPDSPATNHLVVTEINGSKTNTFDYLWDGTLNGWELTSDNGQRKEKRYSSTNGVFRTETHLTRNGSNVVKFEEVKVFETLAWGEELRTNTIGSGANALVTNYTYFTNSLDTANYSRLQRIIQPGGKWKQYTYDAKGRMTSVIGQYLDSPIPANSTQALTNRFMTNIYSGNTVDSWFYINSTETARTIKSFSYERTDSYREQTRGGLATTGDYLLEYRWNYYNEPYIGLPQAIWQEDNTWTFFTYTDSADGKFRTNTVDRGQGNSTSTATAVTNGVRTVMVVDKGGNRLSEYVYDLTTSATSLISSLVVTSNDAFGRPLIIQYLGGLTETYAYGCCGLESFTDREGITTSYDYDYLKRKIYELRDGVGTRYEYDAAGNLERLIRIGTNASEIVLNSSAFDTARRLTNSTAPPNGSGLNRTTTYSEVFDGSNHRVKTTTFPDTGTVVETFFQDGSPLSITGTAAYPRKYEYGIDSTSEFSKEIRVGSALEETEWTKTYLDSLGRGYLAFQADGATNRSYFDIWGQNWKQVDADGNIYRYVFDGRARLASNGIDFDRNGSFSGSVTDRIKQTSQDVISNYGTIVLRTRTYVWPTNNNANAMLVQTDEVSTDGLRRWSSAFGLTNQTITYYAGSGQKTVTNIASDGSYTVEQFINGRATSTTQFNSQGGQLGSASFGYDAHRRRNSVVDARAGTNTFVYNDSDQIASWTIPAPGIGQSAQTTTNYFDSRDRVWKMGLPDNTSVTNEFYLPGLLKKTYGSRQFPVEFTYDSQGRTNTLKTWQNFGSSSGAAITTWNYDTQRGFLNSKRDQSNQGETYTYTSAGRLKTRASARGITSTNTYNFAGGLATVTYSDAATPKLTFDYDRLDRPTNIVQSLSGQFTNTTLLIYTSDGQLLSETNSTGILSGLSVTNNFDSLLRRSAVALNTQSSTLNQFLYDNASRLQTVTNGAVAATYSYLTNSPFWETITFKQGGTTRMTTRRQFDNLNRLQSILSTNASSATLGSFSYGYNNANQRTNASLADSSKWNYGYDSLGQLKSAKRNLSSGTPVAGQQFEYTFDDIGNLKTNKLGGDAAGANLRVAAFSVNLLNQHTNRTVPAAADIIGDAATNATVTVNKQPVVRQAEYFWKELAVNNSSAPVWQGVTNIAVVNNGTNADTITTNIGNILVAKASETLTYDADGNLTSDSLWTNTWNGKNQLITMESQTSVPSAARVKLTFVYDYFGRRIRKIVSPWNGSAYVAQSTNKFIWDGLNLLAELDGTNGLIRFYIRGSDMSGAMQGAGGIGGLLAVSVGTNGTHFVCDDGNGTVANLVDANNSAVSGTFEYDPFKNLIGAFGTMADLLPLTVCNAYYDSETRCYSFVFRYMRDGRWLSQDPSGERGGLNLYGFCYNNPLSYVDRFGLDPIIAPAIVAGSSATWGANVTLDVALANAGITTGGATLLSVAGPIAVIAVASIPIGYDAYLLYDTATLNKQAADTTKKADEARKKFEETKRAVETETYEYTKDFTPTAKAEKDCKTGCVFVWEGYDRGGWGPHTAYINSHFPSSNIGLHVRTPEGLNAYYDAGVPHPIPTDAYELKTGRLWANRPTQELSFVQAIILTRDTVQFGNQSLVAARCKLNYHIWFQQQIGNEGYQRKLPFFSGYMSWIP